MTRGRARREMREGEGVVHQGAVRTLSWPAAQLGWSHAKRMSISETMIATFWFCLPSSSRLFGFQIRERRSLRRVKLYVVHRDPASGSRYNGRVMTENACKRLVDLKIGLPPMELGVNEFLMSQEQPA